MTVGETVLTSCWTVKSLVKDNPQNRQGTKPSLVSVKRKYLITKRRIPKNVNYGQKQDS